MPALMSFSVSPQRRVMVGLEIAILQTTIKFLQGQCLALSFVRRESIIPDELLTIQTLSNEMDTLMIRHLVPLVVCVATSFTLFILII